MQTSGSLRTVIVTGANKGIYYIQKSFRSSIGILRPSKLGLLSLLSLFDKSIDSVDWIKSARHGKVDVLVNNAGIADQKETIETSTLTSITLLGSLRKSYHISPLTVRSSWCQVIRPHRSPKGEAAQLLENNEFTREKLFEGVNRLVEKTKEGKQTELGWSKDAYGASKALLNAYLRFVLVKELKGDQQGFTLCSG